MCAFSIDSKPSSSYLVEQERRARSDTAKSREQLSSGFRILQASDDAAGLQLSAGTSTASKVLAQTIRNVSDGISAASIADSALGALQNITDRLTDLAGRAANSTVSSSERTQLDKEAQALRTQYNFNDVTFCFDDFVRSTYWVRRRGVAGTAIPPVGRHLVGDSEGCALCWLCN